MFKKWPPTTNLITTEKHNSQVINITPINTPVFLPPPKPGNWSGSPSNWTSGKPQFPLLNNPNVTFLNSGALFQLIRLHVTRQNTALIMIMTLPRTVMVLGFQTLLSCTIAKFLLGFTSVQKIFTVISKYREKQFKSVSSGRVHLLLKL